jgi:DNA gyrase subunit A
MGIRLHEGDYVVSVCAVRGDEQMLSITDKGFGKKTSISEYRHQSRGGHGVINIGTADRNGNVVAVMPVTADDQVMIVTTQGKMIRIEVSDIRETSRYAQGVTVIKPGPDDEVAAASLVGKGREVISENVEEPGEEPKGPGPGPAVE